MKKLIGLALVGTLAATALPAKAEILKNFKQHGELEVIGALTSNVTDNTSSLNDNYSTTEARVIYGIGFDLLEDLQSNVTFVKNNRYYGQGAENLNTIQTAVTVEEANVVMKKLFGSLDTKVGRQFYGTEGDMVIYFGPVHGSEVQTVSSLDAVRADYVGNDKLSAHAMWARVAAGTLVTDDSSSILGINGMYKLSDDLNVGGYWYNGRTGNPATNLNGTNLHVIGLKANGKVAGLGYSGELAFNRGAAVQVANQETPSYVGYAYQLKANYKMDMEFGSLNPRAWLAYGSGDNKGAAVANASKDRNFHDINGNITPGEIMGNSRFNGTFNYGGSLSNKTFYNIGIDFAPKAVAKYNVALDYYKFMLSSVAAGASTHVGTEIDLVNTYKYSDTVTLKLSFARLWPEQAIKDTIAAGRQVSPSSKIGSQLLVSF